MNEKQPHANYIALGLAFGTGLGVMVGAVFGYVGLGISFGAGIGIVVGSVLSSLSQNKNPEDDA